MRNGNYDNVRRHVSVTLSVLTVPMRNGNTPLCWFHSQPFRTRSYRTYEEWKRNLIYLRGCMVWRFLPYLWGMETTDISCLLGPRIRFLPYLWGMETSVVALPFDSPSFVLTVPMRNGNRGRKLLRPNHAWFLPYLWGMETQYVSKT